MNTKVCPQCEEEKPYNDDHFHRRSDSKSGLAATCKPCAISRSLEQRVGISSQEREEMFLAQGRRCASCRDRCPDGGHVDHDHDTGMIRGILCGSCNRTLGHAKESPERLRSLIDYLREAP